MRDSKFPYLLPWIFKYLSIIFFVIASVLSYVRFALNIRPKFLDFKVFAIHSKFIETKAWTVIPNNMSEEVIGISLLIGFYFLAFSKEKYESPETNEIRLQSFLLTAFINTILLIFAFLFFFGISFIIVLIIDIYAIFMIYYLIFRIKYKTYKHQARTN
jgi:phosphatidylserine synthase